MATKKAPKKSTKKPSNDTVNKIELYCVKCRKRTPTTNLEGGTHTYTIKKGKRTGQQLTRYALTGTCGVCGTRKTQFMSQKSGEGLLGSLLGLPGGKVPFISDLPIIGSLI